MNRYDSMYEIQKVNANVIGDYVKFQNEQFLLIKDLLNIDQMKSDENKKILFDYVSSFQDNCLNALRAYFGGQEAIFGKDDIDEPVQIKNIEKAVPFTAKRADIRIKEEEEAAPELTVAQIPQEIKREEASVKKAVIEVPEKEIRELVITTIADITGYPDDMLETDMTLEGDLGIDSIKRLELFSNINDKLGSIFGQDDMVALAVVQSIQECIQIIKSIKEDPDHVAWTEEDLELAKTQLMEE